MKQRQRVRVCQIDLLEIDDRDGKPRALQQHRAVSGCGKRRDARRDAAANRRLRFRQRRTQRIERAQHRQARQEQPLRLEHAPDLHQGARKVVHPMERKAGRHQIEPSWCERQPFLIRRDREGSVPRCHARREVRRDHRHPAGHQQRRNHPAAAEVERKLECPRRLIQPLNQSLRRFFKHRGDARDHRRRPLAMAAHRSTIEDLRHRAHSGFDPFPCVL